MSKNRIGIFLLLLLLTVGFATVTANLIINNNANISANTGDFSVIFYSASTDELSSAVISDDKKVITYNTKELVEVGDKSILEYEVKNNSSQYDADINMNIIIPDSINNYIRITYEGFNNIDTTNILAKEIKAGKITIELIKPVIEDMEISIRVELNANAIERESIAYDTYTIRFNPNGGTGEMDEQTIYFDSLTNLSSNQFVKDGYQLLGWSIHSDSSTLDYVDGEEVLKLTSSHTTKDLYAVWMKTDYTYIGNYQEFVAPLDGKYKFELWGASGYSGNSKGGYTSGELSLTKDTTLYVYVGQEGNTTSGGWNGGGTGRNISTAGYYYGGSATDIRTINGAWNNANSLRSRIMVAGAGGIGTMSGYLPYAGGLSGANGVDTNYRGQTGYGGTQTSGGTVSNYSSCGSINGTAGGFGYGGNGGNVTGGSGGGYGGGSGWYGGTGSSRLCSGFFPSGGGSSYISGHTGCVGVTSTSSSSYKSGCSTGTTNNNCSISPFGYTFTNTVMIDGAGYNWTNSRSSYVGQPQPEGTVSTGRTGHGYARISLLEINE